MKPYSAPCCAEPRVAEPCRHWAPQSARRRSSRPAVALLRGDAVVEDAGNAVGLAKAQKAPLRTGYQTKSRRT